MDRLKAFYKKYKDIIPYAFFGVCTTVVNVLSYAMLEKVLHIGIMLSTIVAWLFAVLFAYFTNRKWVFHSTAKGTCSILKEIFLFFSSRIATGIVDWIIMFVFVEMLAYNDMIIKILANVIVIILNYIASKWVVFRHDKS